MIKREIIENFVDYFSFVILLVIDATFVWATFKFVIEYPITWTAACGGCILLKYVKSEIKSTTFGE